MNHSPNTRYALKCSVYRIKHSLSVIYFAGNSSASTAQEQKVEVMSEKWIGSSSFY